MTTSTNRRKKTEIDRHNSHVDDSKMREKSFHLWTSMIFVISTNNVRMLALIDNDFNQNFIDQRLAYEWRLSADENSSTNSQTMNETFLKMFKFHFLKFSSKKNDEKILKIEQNLMSIHMIEVNVILKMSWLREINSIVNWSTDKWRFKKISRHHRIKFVTQQASRNQNISRRRAIFT
jgi:hypothetical protein